VPTARAANAFLAPEFAMDADGSLHAPIVSTPRPACYRGRQVLNGRGLILAVVIFYHDGEPCRKIPAHCGRCMGGDLGPVEVVEAVRLAFREFPQLNPVTLVGDEAILRPLLKRARIATHPKLSVLHASKSSRWTTK